MNRRADIHVLPLNDTIDHLELRECVCRPRIEKQSDCPAVVVHHAADGREYFEDGHTPLESEQ